MNAEQWIEELNLEPHPEGGFFKEVYRSQEQMDAHGGSRAVCTHIYFLLREGEFSQWHRIRSDEHWHFYAGGPLGIRMIDEEGSTDFRVLGSKVHRDEHLHTVVEGGTWFGSRPLPGSSFSLVGCTVAPGFDFQDFEMTDPDQLSGQFSELDEFIRGLTE